jgi:diaminohydroxyphosphoribosylaminopyrimidine deaminase / 5-amino-6-(5-phosphoribosylamino)uracil reductase
MSYTTYVSYKMWDIIAQEEPNPFLLHAPVRPMSQGCSRGRCSYVHAMREQKELDEKFMRAALTEAAKGLGTTSPNPAVGAVLVKRNRVIARGYHRQAGGDHAEVDCLRKVAGPFPADAILYVTLEPCSTRGRTAPCANYIIERGVRRVVIGTIDPNPVHRGRAIELLRAAGIEVIIGILEKECARLNEAFNKWIVTGEPMVIAKCGMSLDGHLTRPAGESRWLTSERSRVHAHKLREVVDAIMVGAETIRRDDPRLTVRSGPRRPQPWRVILTKSGRLPRTAKVFCDAHWERTLVYRNKSLRAVLRDLGQREITSLLIEGGGQVLSQALDQGLIDKVQIYLAPIFTGGNVLAFGGRGAASTEQSLRLASPLYQRIGEDICVTGYPKRAKSQ